MDEMTGSRAGAHAPEASGRVSRRAVLLMTASVAAGATSGVAKAAEQSSRGGDFGSPVVELHVPAGVLTLEQKSAMIKGITDVVLGAMKLSPDPARPMFVEIIETADAGYGVNGRVFVPRRK